MKNFHTLCNRFHRNKLFVLLSCFLVSSWCFIVVSKIFAVDLLENAFQASKQYDQVINLWNNKNAVGNEVFQQGTNVNVSLTGGWVTATTQAPLYVRITQFLLRITVLLSVTMILYNGVLYVASAGDAGKASAARKAIVNVIIGLIIAFISLSIVYLAQSITLGTLPGIFRW